MTKPTITKLWLAGLVVLAVGLVVTGVGVGLMLGYGGHFVPAPGGNGSDFVPTLDGLFWATVGLVTAGVFVAVAGLVVQLAAWIGAVVNTYQLTDKTWFAVLLAGGLLGLVFGVVGFAATVAYLIAGPDGTAMQQPDIAARTPPPALLVPTT
jgi:hypothetical protein